MEKTSQDKLNMCPEDLALLASSFAISLSKNFSFGDMETLKVFFSTLASNISLIQHQTKKCNDNKRKG